MKANRSKIISVFLVAFTAALLLRTFIFEGFIVLGDSMEPTIESGEYVLVNKLAYLWSEPNREDIIVVIPREIKQKVVKRVIGLPGERFDVENGKVLIGKTRTENGLFLSESYTKTENTPEIGINHIKLDPKEYFALGDNREVSIDSRELGPVDIWDIRGRVFASFSLKALKFRLF